MSQGFCKDLNHTKECLKEVSTPSNKHSKQSTNIGCFCGCIFLARASNYTKNCRAGNHIVGSTHSVVLACRHGINKKL